MKKLKKVVGILMALITCFTCFSFAACANGSSLEISETAVRMTKYETITLSVKTSGNVEWNCSNGQIAVLTANGKTAQILAIAVGETTVTAKAGNNVVSCKLTVYPSEEEIKLNLLSAGQTLLVTGEQSQIQTDLTYLENKIDNAKINYSLISQSPTGCVSVDQNGKITANSKGTATIKVQAEYYGNLSNEVCVSVISVPQAELVLEQTKLTLFTDERYPTTAQISAKIFADGDVSDVETLQVESSDQTIAVFENGVIKSKGIGKATLTFTCDKNGKSITSEVAVTVKDKPNVKVSFSNSEITLNNKSYTIESGAVYSSTAKVSAGVIVDDEQIENAQFSYGIKDGQGVLSITPEGVVTGLQKGVATVIATYVDKWGVENVAECNVTIDGPVYYGQHESYKHDGLVAELNKVSSTEVSTLAIKDVSLANDKNTELVKFQYIPDDSVIGTKNYSGARAIQIVVQDAEDLDNFFWVSVVYVTTGSAPRVGVRTKGMGAYSDTQYGSPDSTISSSDKNYSCSSGWAVSGLPWIFCGEGLSATNYEDYMLGLSMEGSTVYMTFNGKTNRIWDLINDTKAWADNNVDSSLTKDMVWDGFTSNKVNIYIRGDKYAANTESISYVSIDKIAGQKTTAANVKDIEYVTTKESAYPVPAK